MGIKRGGSIIAKGTKGSQESNEYNNP